MDQGSGCWVVLYIEFLVWVMAFLLLEAYDCARIWAMRSALCRLARDLILEPTLDSMVNVNEELRILRVI